MNKIDLKPSVINNIFACSGIFAAQNRIWPLPGRFYATLVLPALGLQRFYKAYAIPYGIPDSELKNSNEREKGNKTVGAEQSRTSATIFQSSRYYTQLNISKIVFPNVLSVSVKNQNVLMALRATSIFDNNTIASEKTSVSQYLHAKPFMPVSDRATSLKHISSAKSELQRIEYDRETSMTFGREYKHSLGLNSPSIKSIFHKFGRVKHAKNREEPKQRHHKLLTTAGATTDRLFTQDNNMTKNIAENMTKNMSWKNPLVGEVASDVSSEVNSRDAQRGYNTEQIIKSLAVKNGEAQRQNITQFTELKKQLSDEKQLNQQGMRRLEQSLSALAHALKAHHPASVFPPAPSMFGRLR